MWPDGTRYSNKTRQYLRFHPDGTTLSVTAKGAGVIRHTAAKHYEMVRGGCWDDGGGKGKSVTNMAPAHIGNAAI